MAKRTNRVAWGLAGVLASVLLAAGTWVVRVYYGIVPLRIYSDGLVIGPPTNGGPVPMIWHY